MTRDGAKIGMGGECFIFALSNILNLKKTNKLTKKPPHQPTKNQLACWDLQSVAEGHTARLNVS